jgi:hypothetical protein
MADHLRTQIRRALVELLIDKNADVGVNVFTGRVHPLVKDKEVPAADVDFGRFSGRPDGGPIRSEPTSEPTRLLDRYPVMTLSVTVRQADGYLDAIDAVYKDYEIALAEDNTLGGLVARISPIGEPLVALSGEGDMPVARAEMQFEVEYVTAFNAPSQPA